MVIPPDHGDAAALTEEQRATLVIETNRYYESPHPFCYLRRAGYPAPSGKSDASSRFLVRQGDGKSRTVENSKQKGPLRNSRQECAYALPAWI
jgi:hypothetical protein